MIDQGGAKMRSPLKTYNVSICAIFLKNCLYFAHSFNARFSVPEVSRELIIMIQTPPREANILI